MTDLADQLVSERLVLRPPTQDDAPELNRAVAQSHRELHRWMAWAAADEPQSVEETLSFCKEAQRKCQEGVEYPVLMTLLSTGAIIGASGFAAIDWEVPLFEIGYWVRSDCVGHGYASEAARRLTRYAFEDLDAVRVELRMDNLNVRSWSVAERLGFDWEATLKKVARAYNSELRDTRLYAMFSLADLG